MEVILVSIFLLGYLAITLEQALKLDKLIFALLMMVLVWSVAYLGIEHLTAWHDAASGTLLNGENNLLNFATASTAIKQHIVSDTLLYHFGKTAEILFFLIGAMTIVEIIDHFDGFSSIKGLIRSKSKLKLLWAISMLGFVLSAIIDNLTTTIVLITILRKIIADKQLRLWYAGFIIIAANAGGAWSPIGDVTTTMLWIGHKLSALRLIETILLPSLVCLLTPLSMAFFMKPFKGEIDLPTPTEAGNSHSKLMVIIGLSMIIFVPIFKMLTGLPPYFGMLLGLALTATCAEIISHRDFSLSEREEQLISPTFKALSKIEMPSVLFFLGILMAVAALESVGSIAHFGNFVSSMMPETSFITLLGLGSAIFDNVPLVAASMGMFQDGFDASIWHLIAYAAGTGGSILIIGSAAGVVAMGMEKINFFWYLKNISLLALLGYFTGIGTFLILSNH